MSDLGLFDEEPDGTRGSRRSTSARSNRRRRGRRRRRRRSNPLAPLAAVLVLVLFVGGLGYLGYARLRDYLHPPDYDGTGTGQVTVNVRHGDSATDIGTTLRKSEVVKSVDAFVDAVQDGAQQSNMKPGYYQMHKHMKATLALKMLLDPDSRVNAKVTVVEGTRATEIYKLLSKKTGISVRDFTRAARHPEKLGVPDWGHGVEGFLYPATYRFDPDATATGILKKMVGRFDQTATKLHLTSKARKLNLKPREALTVASLAQAEGGTTADYPKVARVVYNRVQKSDFLQLDTTVLYALGERRLRVYHKDLGVRSPYNTYKHRGLPPGPICSPGEEAIQAALSPDQGDWYYFVTTDPKHKVTKFTDSYRQFAKYKKELYRNIGGG